MFRKSLLAIAVLALMAPAARGEDAKLPTVDEIVAHHVKARGGLDKIKAVKTMKFTGTMAIGPGMEAPFVMEQARPNMQRMEFTIQGMTGIQAFDGKTGWAVMPFMGKKDPEAMSADDSKQMLDDSDFDGALVDYKEKGHTVELVGKEQVEGADVYKLKITMKSGSVRTVYIDAESWLEIKTEAKRTVRGTEIEGETIMGDYKEVNGLMMPFSVAQGAKGSDRRQTMTFSKIELDVPFEAAHFAMPAAADSTKATASAAAAKADSTAKTATKDAKDAGKKSAPLKKKS
jgi:hypothetical protein